MKDEMLIGDRGDAWFVFAAARLTRAESSADAIADVNPDAATPERSGLVGLDFNDFSIHLNESMG